MKLKIRGKKKLQGVVKISGSKFMTLLFNITPNMYYHMWLKNITQMRFKRNETLNYDK